MRRKTDRLQARPANFIDRHRCHIRRQAAPQGGLTRGVLAQAGLDDITHNDFIDLLRSQTGPLDNRFDDQGSQLGSAHGFEHALEFTNRSADCTDDDDFFHGGLLKPTYHRHKVKRGNSGQT